MQKGNYMHQINKNNCFLLWETMNLTIISLLGKNKNGTTIFPTGNEECNDNFLYRKNGSNAKIKYFEFDFPMINKNT